MKRIQLFLLIAIFVVPLNLSAQSFTYKYRVYLKDKSESPYKVSKPSKFLSDEALKRRKKWNIKVDEKDLPVSPTYVKQLADKGVKVLCVSKWNNTALVQDEDTNKINSLTSLPFVSKVLKVYHGKPYVYATDVTEKRKATVSHDSLPNKNNYYGNGFDQIFQLNGIKLHEAGFKGKGMKIAILDGGFNNADVVGLLSNVNILGTHNFVRPGQSVFDENTHGTNVLSCMASNAPYHMVGTAPEASYWLLVSEDSYSETAAEEDYWAAALEYADSVGADVVNSSLGYAKYDGNLLSYKYVDLNGLTSLISNTASMAASRGLLVVNSAGNSGNETWKLIGVPADARDILSVGAIDSQGVNADFSSLGNTADGRIKPDIVARGVRAAVINTDGKIGTANGTSFASPITAGMVACLMQALPKKNPVEIIQLIHKCGSYAEHPNNVFGYGIPDYWKAYQEGK